MIAKVVRPDGSIAPDAEARAIRWAADNGARVINLSLGGLRDPLIPRRDTYSRAEQNAIAYAYGKGAVVVAAVGNGDQAPTTPWNYASYPAALPHVLGVSALAPDGSVPAFSNRDAALNDISAPGVGIVSTLPRSLTAARASCVEQGYSLCGPPEFRSADGTSYAAAQVPAAAALLIAQRPTLTPDQVTAVLERSATDVNAATGCSQCELLRDRYSGWGRLDVTAALRALSGPLPAPDRYEGNDDAGDLAFTLYGRSIDVSATLDFWDDQIDVYRIRLRKGQTVAVSLRGPAGTDTNLALWSPGTKQVEGLSATLQARRVTQSAHAGVDEHFLHRARAEGWYYVEVKLTTPGAGQYRLHISKIRACRHRQVSAPGVGVAPRPGRRAGASPGCRRRARAGTSFVTTAPAPTKASSPISIPGQRIAPPPTRAPRLIVGPLTRSWRRSVRPMKLSLVVTTHGAMKTSSSSVEYAVM